MMVRSIRTLLLTALCAVFVADCGSESSEPRSLDATYRLISLNGYALPVANAVYPDSGVVKLAVWDGTLALHSNGTYKLDMTVGSNATCYHDAGTFTIAGSRIDFESTQEYPVAMLASRAYTGGQLSAAGMTFSQMGADPVTLEFLQGIPGNSPCYSP